MLEAKMKKKQRGDRSEVVRLLPGVSLWTLIGWRSARAGRTETHRLAVRNRR